jgi:pimeloyl-ACP methyl ester carboxylesterase
METLGPPAFNFCGKRFTRTDFCLRTKRGYNLECSHWEPVERATDRIPVVIYMHGNSSARVEVIPQLSYLLSLGLAVFSFDFAGSGKSDGEYVSLGYYEREDLSCIVAHLRATNVVSTIALWGRSMGAATALMFGDRDPSIACMILDSPFCDLTQLCEEMVEKGREQGIIVPNLVVSIAIRMLQSSVKKQAGFNIRQISPIAHADKCFIPALFVAGEHDDFIKKHHSEQIHQVYAGDKNLIIVEGDHNSPRPKFMFDSASIFLQTCLQIPNEWALQVPVSMNLMSPPWFYELHQQRAAARRHQHELLQQQLLQQQQQQLLSMATNSSNGSVTSGATTSSATTARAGTSSSAIASSSSANHMDPTSNGFNHEDMGMTAERQRVIQASLFKMLGQADSVDTITSTSSSTGKKKQTTRRSNSGGVKDDMQHGESASTSSSSNMNNAASAASSSMGVEVGIPLGPPRSSTSRTNSN